MKERPIIFSAPMVRANLDGTKTQTRRVVKAPRWSTADEIYEFAGLAGVEDDDGEHFFIKCPHGQPGERLWVRESFQPLFADGVENHWETDWRTGKGYAVSYPATDGIHEYLDADDNLKDACKPSVRMPRWASRITLEITDVRVERLQDISEADAIAEGIKRSQRAISPSQAVACFWDYLRNEPQYRCPVSSFSSLWESISGPGSWDASPWVWVITFRRVQP